jgi:hypothetical protein
MDEFPHRMLALADRIGYDCVVPVTMPGFFGGMQNAGEHPPVGESNAYGSAEKGFNLLIGHASGNRLRVLRGCAPRENLRNGG